MAKKLYILGIGGTGSRVLKALTLLFAAGVKLPAEFDMVIPIIIDPDTGNGDLNRVKDILRLYQEVRNQVDSPEDFFYQEIKTINELTDNSVSVNPDYFQFKLHDTDQNTFGEYIGYDTLSEDYLGCADDKNFVRLFYADKNLKSNLDVGFKGCPNMGAVVLNQFTESEDFKKFAATFNDGDAIFIINSIFGGTGAAGFPLLLKNLRDNDDLDKAAKIKAATIGNITYLPYFALNKQDEINSNSFDEKAKAALDYYNRTIIKPNKINTIYFVGNRGNTNHEEYSVGGMNQKNKAHFLELAGALAILDFCENVDIKSAQTVVKEFGIEKDTDSIRFSDLNLENAHQISTPLTKYKLFVEYLDKGLQKGLAYSRWTRSNIKCVGTLKQSVLDRNYFQSIEYTNQIVGFNKYFNEWLLEMKDNKPSFAPFREITSANALDLVVEKKTSRNRSFQQIDTENCLLADNQEIRSNTKKHTTLIKTFGRSTGKVLKKNNLLIK